MRRTSLLFALLATAAVAASARAGDVALKSPWDGFAEGSWVLHKATTKEQGGDPPTPDSVLETRMTLTKVTEKAYAIKLDQKIGEDWIGTDLDFPRVGSDLSAPAPDAKVEELGEEKLIVDGDVAVNCKKQKTTAADAVTTSWTSEKYGLMKSESKGAAGESAVEVTKLETKVKIKDKEVVCRVTRTTMKSAEFELTSSTWTSDAVPGGEVRTESTTKMGGRTSTTVKETSDFEKKTTDSEKAK